jgi:hypothetical protein
MCVCVCACVQARAKRGNKVDGSSAVPRVRFSHVTATGADGLCWMDARGVAQAEPAVRRTLATREHATHRRLVLDI